ncbi:hypothetical protein [Streptomyces sp. NPDC058268]|uniref:hypothetical protein n=1 Tax=Streptomyces sp. NPDC058268 TaxID=3346413 RepID=UPI0036F08CDE
MLSLILVIDSCPARHSCSQYGDRAAISSTSVSIAMAMPAGHEEDSYSAAHELLVGKLQFGAQWSRSKWTRM